ncbi:MAG: hypothetical protein ACXWJC_06530 [Croceibacterium sp.]
MYSLPQGLPIADEPVVPVSRLQALRFAVYHLNSAANPADERVSIGARGLTGDDYHGHVFWDAGAGCGSRRPATSISPSSISMQQPSRRVCPNTSSATHRDLAQSSLT